MNVFYFPQTRFPQWLVIDKSLSHRCKSAGLWFYFVELVYMNKTILLFRFLDKRVHQHFESNHRLITINMSNYILVHYFDKNAHKIFSYGMFSTFHKHGFHNGSFSTNPSVRNATRQTITLLCRPRLYEWDHCPIYSFRYQYLLTLDSNVGCWVRYVINIKYTKLKSPLIS